MPIKADPELRNERFGVLALAYIDSLYRFALYMTEDESDAQLLVQNTYLEAYRMFDKLQEDSDCKAWLLSILNGKLMNTVHRDGIYLEVIPPLGTTEPLTDSAHGDMSVGYPLDNDVAAAIRQLPIGYRAAVLLADMEGFSYKEIAGIVGRSIETVMSRVCRGRRMLDNRLRNWDAQEIAEAAG